MSGLPLFALLLAGAGVLVLAVDQARRGRIRTARPVRVDAAAFERRVLAAPPEVIGAAWDEAVDANEVKALLARLLLDGRISAGEEGCEMVLSLRAPRAAFDRPQEQALVSALFCRGDSIRRTALEQHYGPGLRIDPKGSYDIGDIPRLLGVDGKTFDLADTIRDELLAQARLLDDATAPPPRGIERPELFASLVRPGALWPDEGPPDDLPVPDRAGWVYLLTLLVAAEHIFPNKGEDPGQALGWGTGLLLLVATVGHFLAMRAAESVRRRPRISPVHLILPVLPLLAAPLLSRVLPTSDLAAFFLGILVAASLVNALLRARSVDEPTRGRLREELAACRRFLETQLAEGIPDGWIPYAIAFGLGSRVLSSPEPFRPFGSAAAWSVLVDSLVAPVSGGVR